MAGVATGSLILGITAAATGLAGRDRDWETVYSY